MFRWKVPLQQAVRFYAEQVAEINTGIGVDAGGGTAARGASSDAVGGRGALHSGLRALLSGQVKVNIVKARFSR
ncbi:hypothetical protein EYF80_017257 [Liparis tanakae]|uniref:Uncharacterized protein n=1 Tax=Liparis tanakae TaxID=230148 RepID=A0A4Z2I3Y8_9TELE|nr:hypothetical protein EYF80_017257 [Liparis tanakae]